VLVYPEGDSQTLPLQVAGNGRKIPADLKNSSAYSLYWCTWHFQRFSDLYVQLLAIPEAWDAAEISVCKTPPYYWLLAR